MKYILILFLINCCYCVQSNKVCDPTLALCSPTWNETWYEYTAHTFSRNLNNTVFLANNITSFDLHLLTINPKSNFKRTIKSWFNLTDPDLTVNVNSDWFPTELTEGPNRTWTFYAFLLSQNALLDPTAMNLSDAFTAFHVIQSPVPPVIVDITTSRPWIIALIVIASILILLTLITLLYFWRKRTRERRLLSQPDAILIAQRFREAMHTSEVADRNQERAQDLLQRELEAERGTLITDIKQFLIECKW
ncbi:unnamed protein product [Rhizopus stolonifer]